MTETFGKENEMEITNKVLRLDANEGRCLLDKEQLSFLLSPEIARRYPDSRPLEAELARQLGLEQASVIATAGADDAIDRAIRSIAGSGGTVVSTTPGFVEFLEAALRSKAEFAAIHKVPGSPFPVNEITAYITANKPEIFLIASPDNPTGVVLDPKEFTNLAKVCDENGTVFILDLTYQDFAEDQSLFSLAIELPNVLITGSFSKSKGLAGFRIGWAAAGPRSSTLIEKLRQAGPPFSLSSPAIEAARLALAIPNEKQAAFVGQIRKERQLLKEHIEKLGAKTWPSEANFVTVIVANPQSIVAILKDKGILIRAWPGNQEAANLIRITCPGDEVEFSRLLEAIDSMEANVWQA
jgi:histidinol-phosphate aminotransferase